MQLKAPKPSVTSDGEAVAAGAAFGVKIKPSMGLSERTATASEYAPPNRVVFDVRMNGMTSIITHMVSAEGAGSRVTRRIELKLQADDPEVQHTVPE
jgi:hypothetical protein